MASNLRIGYCEIPLAATSTSISTSASTTYPLTNLFGGNKADYFRAATAASGDHRITFDLGSGNTLDADFLFIAKANMLQKSAVGTVTLKGHSSNSYAGATTVQNTTGFGLQTLYGPHAEDYILNFTASSAYRWWFVNYNATSTSLVPHAKLFFGSAFDPGRDPDTVSADRVRTDEARRKAIWTYRFGWQGLSYEKTVQMHRTFAVNKRINPVVLMTSDYDDLLHGSRCLLARVTEFSAPPRATDFNNVSMTCEELV